MKTQQVTYVYQQRGMNAITEVVAIGNDTEAAERYIATHVEKNATFYTGVVNALQHEYGEESAAEAHMEGNKGIWCGPDGIDPDTFGFCGKLYAFPANYLDGAEEWKGARK